MAHKLDLLYDFYIKRHMHAVEWKLNAMNNKNNNLVNKLDRTKINSSTREIFLIPVPNT